jgi:hypothetical protein
VVSESEEEVELVVCVRLLVILLVVSFHSHELYP